MKDKGELRIITEVDKEYASLPVKTTVLKSGKSVILPLIVSPIGLGENTTLILDIITKKLKKF